MDGTWVGRITEFLLLTVWYFLVNNFLVHVLYLYFLSGQKFL